MTTGFTSVFGPSLPSPTSLEHFHAYPKTEILIMDRCCRCFYVRRDLTISNIYFGGFFDGCYYGDYCPYCHHYARHICSNDAGWCIMEENPLKSDSVMECTCCFYTYRRMWQCWACGNENIFRASAEFTMPEDNAYYGHDERREGWAVYEESLQCKKCKYPLGLECVLFWKPMKPRDQILEDWKNGVDGDEFN